VKNNPHRSDRAADIVTDTLFISDLHLSDERPEITALFSLFLRNDAAKANALYILGDLFEVWLGDDAVLPAYRPVVEGIRTLASGGVPVYVMHGNRDFLIGAGFVRQTGCRLLPDPSVIDLAGERTLLMHGDTLCTDDVEYQRFRLRVRNPDTQRQFLALPINERIAVAKLYREESRERSRYKTEEIMDVNQSAVMDAMRQLGVYQLIHGHTHRPAVHDFILDNRAARRIVLGDWYEQASILKCTMGNCRLESIPKR
jgi:UDP-2,3-diacylglucosamine hydrolase